jgi:hypothetical protein
MRMRGYGPEGSENLKDASMITEAALGHGGTWWIRFENGLDNWDFAGGYKELEQIFKGGDIDPKTINVCLFKRSCTGKANKLTQYLALSPFSNQHYFLVHESIKVR